LQKFNNLQKTMKIQALLLNKINSTKKGKSYIICTILGFALLIGAFVLVARMLHYKFEMYDEGFYLDCAWRHLKGDKFFVDDISALFRSFDLFLYSLMKIIPFDTVLTWRWVGYILQILYLAVFSILLLRIIPLPVLLLVTLPCLLYMPFNLWTVSYKNTNVGFAIMGSTMWLICLFVNKKIFRNLLAMGAGILFFCMFITYSPLGGLVIIPLGVLILSRFKIIDKRLGDASKILLLTFTVSFILMLLFLFYAGFIKYIVEGFKAYKSVGIYSYNEIIKFLKILMFSKRIILCGLASFVIGILLNKLPSRKKRILVLFVLFIIWLIFLGFYRGPHYGITLGVSLTFFNFSIMGFTLGRIFSCWKTMHNYLHFQISLILFVTACLAFFIPTMFSAFGSLSEGNTTIWLLWPAAIAVLWTTSTKLKGNVWDFGNLINQYFILLPMVLFALFHLLLGLFYEGGISKFKFTFSHPKLKGIYETEQRVKDIDALLSAIESITKKGDFLLLCRSPVDGARLYGLTYLTETRPALKLLVAEFGSPTEFYLNKWLAEMELKGRRPRYAITSYVVYAANKEATNYAVADYILKNYTPYATVGLYKIWRLKEAQ